MRIFKLIIKVSLGIGMIYLISVMYFVLKPDINDLFNRTDFVSSEWINWEDDEASYGVRWNMTHDLTKKYELIGKTKKEIIQLLGRPTSESKNEMNYYLGLTGHGINTGSLSFEFENGQVIRFKIRQG